ncbi:MAG TPA: 2OG-Fe(II) oxygenase [Cellvibrio sp.]|nr:2OG-Fe(II) oxygenase [Cellvibrio sp.]
MGFQKLAEGIFIIDNFLDKDECKQLIALSESLGYKPADVDVHGQRQMLSMIRTNERVDMESREIAAQFWQKLKAINMPDINGEQPIGLTPFFRFYRYEGEQKFNMHKDGRKEYKGSHTRLTMLVYLSDLKDSGATRFRDARIDVFPKSGKALLFRHELWHAGMPVNNGIKYVLRTDVLFEPGSEEG